MFRSLGETIFLRQFSANQMIDGRVFRPGLKRPVTEFPFLNGFILKMCHDGLVRPRQRLGLVNLKHLVQEFSGVGILFGIDAMIGSVQQGRNMSRVQT